MSFPQEYLEKIAVYAQMFLELKNSDEARVVMEAAYQIAADVKPVIEELNRFATEQDIAAVKQIMEAGFTEEQAIKMRTSGMLTTVTEALGAMIKNKYAKE